MKLLLHTDTENHIEHFLKQPSHALLLEGEAGSGKGAVADYISAEILGLNTAALGSYPFLLRTLPEKKTISIATVRNMQDFLRLKTTGTGVIRRIIIVENAHCMTVEAQNAFLKLLEEPPPDTLIILTAINNQTLLATIYSRVQRIRLKALTKNRLTEHFKSAGFTEPVIEKAYYVSEGHIGLMQALLSEDTAHPLVHSVEAAKSLINKPVYERLIEVDALAKEKETIPDLLYALQRICHAALLLATEKQRDVQIQKSHQALKRIIAAEAKLRHNPNTKLLLTDLLLGL